MQVAVILQYKIDYFAFYIINVARYFYVIFFSRRRHFIMKKMVIPFLQL